MLAFDNFKIFYFIFYIFCAEWHSFCSFLLQNTTIFIPLFSDIYIAYKNAQNH